MSTYGLTVVAIAAGSAAIGAGRQLIERRRARKVLARHAELGTESPEGTVTRITGVVRATGAMLEAPLSGTPCVVARARVWTGLAYTRQAMKPLEQLTMVPFELVRDDGPPVTVVGAGALLDLAAEPRHRFAGLWYRPSPEERVRRDRLMLEIGVEYKLRARASVEEVVVREGQRVSIVGLMMRDVSEEPPSVAVEQGYRDVAPASIRIAGNADHPLVIGRPVT